MAEWFLGAGDFRVVRGVVSAPAYEGQSWPGIRCFSGGHPVPNEASAVADGTTLERAQSLDMDPADYLARSDSHTFFKRLGDDITCGPTQNNVRDIRVLVSWP